jgi:hypothetical protein
VVVRHLGDHNLVTNARVAVVALIAQVLLVKSLKVAKPAIHAGFALHLKNAIHHVFAHASLNQIFLMMLLVKNLRRAFVQNF